MLLGQGVMAFSSRRYLLPWREVAKYLGFKKLVADSHKLTGANPNIWPLRSPVESFLRYRLSESPIAPLHPPTTKFHSLMKSRTHINLLKLSKSFRYCEPDDLIDNISRVNTHQNQAHSNDQKGQQHGERCLGHGFG